MTGGNLPASLLYEERNRAGVSIVAGKRSVTPFQATGCTSI